MSNCALHWVWDQPYYTNERGRCGTQRAGHVITTHTENSVTVEHRQHIVLPEIFKWVTLPLSVMTYYLNRSSQPILENQLGINSHNATQENIFYIWCGDNDKWIMREKVRSTLSPSKCALWETEKSNLISIKSERNDIQYWKGFIKLLMILNLFILWESFRLPKRDILQSFIVLWIFKWELQYS